MSRVSSSPLLCKTSPCLGPLSLLFPFSRFHFPLFLSTLYLAFSTPNLIQSPNPLSIYLNYLSLYLFIHLYFFLSLSVDADGVSGGEDSFDPDEGFSSGASSSSQPSVKKDAAGATPRPSREREGPTGRLRDLAADTRAALRRLHQRHQSPPPLALAPILHSPRTPEPSPPQQYLDPRYVPAFGLPLIRTASTSSSKSLDCGGFNGSTGPSASLGSLSAADRPHCLSAISLQEDRLSGGTRSQGRRSPGSPFSSASPLSKESRSRSSSFNMQIISQV